MARASALGSRAAKTEKKTDTPWGVGARSDASTTRALRAAFDPESVGLPRAFDARVAFPKCAGVIGSVRDQGKCGSCWAVAATEVMNDRLCVASGGRRRRELSPQYALSCFDAGAGCDGEALPADRRPCRRGQPLVCAWYDGVREPAVEGDGTHEVLGVGEVPVLPEER